jgi:amidase
VLERETYLGLDAVGLAELVAKGETTPTELLETALAEAERQNPALNAIVIPMHDLARDRARSDELTGPFAGVPFLIKDLTQDYAGVLNSGGSRALKEAGHTPTEHGEIVRRFLNAGTVIFGRTNTPEFGAVGTTEPEAWGPTANPYDLSRSPGGSSGGSAAAVAAGIVPMAGGGDGGGSIRIPAACCGLFGLKPGRGRTPSGPVLAERLHGAVCGHVLTRSVRDSAAMLDAIHGPEAGSRSLYPLEDAFLDRVSQDPRRLRIAFTSRSPIGGKVDPEIVAATNTTARWLEALGHEVEEREIPVDGEALASDFMTVWFAQLSATVKEVRTQYPDQAWDFESDTLVVEAVGDARKGPDYNAAYRRWTQYSVEVDRFFETCDVYLTPTLASEPPKTGSLSSPSWSGPAVRRTFPLGLRRLVALASPIIERVARDNLEGRPFTQLANIAGVPAMSVPLHTFERGLPLGMQFMAPFGDEATLLSLAGQLERAHPWAHRRPPG